VSGLPKATDARQCALSPHRPRPPAWPVAAECDVFQTHPTRVSLAGPVVRCAATWDGLRVAAGTAGLQLTSAEALSELTTPAPAHRISQSAP